MKTLLLTLTLALSQTALADSLFFGAKSEKFARNEFCTYKFSIPQVAPAPGSTARTQSAAAALNAKWDAQLASAKAEFQTKVLDPDNCKGLDSAYQVATTFKIGSSLDAQIASIVTTDSGYYGGAHGSYALSGLTFNATTGQIYGDLSDFLEDSKLDALKAAILAAAKEKVPSLDPEFGWNDWNKETVLVSQIKNWYFSPDGLVVIFNPYEIASYADGAIEATVYFYSLKEMGALKTTGPATLLDVPSDL